MDLVRKIGIGTGILGATTLISSCGASLKYGKMEGNISQLVEYNKLERQTYDGNFGRAIKMQREQPAEWEKVITAYERLNILKKDEKVKDALKLRENLYKKTNRYRSIAFLSFLLCAIGMASYTPSKKKDSS